MSLVLPNSDLFDGTQFVHRPPNGRAQCTHSAFGYVMQENKLNLYELLLMCYIILILKLYFCYYWPTRPRPNKWTLCSHKVSVRPSKKTPYSAKTKYTTTLNGAWWVTLKSPDLLFITFKIVPLKTHCAYVCTMNEGKQDELHLSKKKIRLHYHMQLSRTIKGRVKHKAMGIQNKVTLAEILCMVSFEVYCFFLVVTLKETSYINFKYFIHTQYWLLTSMYSWLLVTSTSKTVQSKIHHTQNFSYNVRPFQVSNNRWLT